MLFSQLPDLKDVVAVRDSFGLAVTVLVAVVGLLILGIALLIRWARPLMESIFRKLIASHLLTMRTFRKNDTERTRQLGLMSALQAQISQKLEEIPTTIAAQSEMLEAIIEKQTVMVTRRLDTLSAELLSAHKATEKRDERREAREEARNP